MNLLCHPRRPTHFGILQSPASLLDRPHLSLRLEADEWVHRGDDLRRCVVLRLERAALVGGR